MNAATCSLIFSNKNENDMSDSRLLWGIDVGGTKIEGVTLRPGKQPEIISRIRIPTEKEKGYEHIIGQIQNLLNELSQKTGENPDKVGFGIPGILDPATRTVKNANTTTLNGKPFKDDLQATLNLQVKLANDANCFALAESKFGAAYNFNPNAEVIFGIIMGTGVGGGIIANGKILHGLHGIGGEWGHNFLDESGGKCYCGKTGCVETVISGPALEKYYKRLSGQSKTLKEINSLHEQNLDPYATRTIQRLCHFFGKGIAHVINIIDPEIIVIGGGLGNIQSLSTEGLEGARKFVFNHSLNTTFLQPKLGDSAGVIGAAFLADSETHDKK
jgi:predicted NBD/HSP70 family sugar kinase